jgi:hypothetical protein
MAVTASIALSAVTCRAEQRVTATCTISNGNVGALFVSYIVPTMTPVGSTAQSVAVAVGVAPTGGAYAVTVASGGTANISWDVLPHAPNSGFGGAEPATIAYSVGATIGMSDGTLVIATAATLTVSPPPLGQTLGH